MPPWPKVPALPAPLTVFRAGQIKVPAGGGAAGGVVPELGSPLFSAKGGSHSGAYLQGQLAGDCNATA